MQNSRVRWLAPVAAAALLVGVTTAALVVSNRPSVPLSEQFVARNGSQLTLGGSAYRFDGLNIPQATGAPCWRQRDLEAALDAIGPGQEVIRAFVFQRTATTNGARDWTMVDRMLDILRSKAERVVMVLTDQWHGQPCTDTPADRTIDWYQVGYRTIVEGATTYRDWVRQIVTRYRDNPTIAAWELVNEPQAANADGSCSEGTAASTLRSFADDMAALVKSIDPNHLVSLGATPDHCGTDRGDYRLVNESPALDLCDYHDYQPGSPLGSTDPRNGLVASIEQCREIDKPLFVGEVGIGFTSITPPTLDERAARFDAKFSAQFGAGSVGELLWTWSQEFSDVPPRDLEIAPGDPALKLLTRY